MSHFLEDAANILDTAERVVRSGQTLTAMAILIGSDGGIQMIADPVMPLEALLAEYGAETAYEVEPYYNAVRVQGREHGRKCRIESEAPEQAMWVLLGGRRVYTS